MSTSHGDHPPAVTDAKSSVGWPDLSSPAHSLQQVINTFVISMTQALCESEVRMTTLITREVAKCKTDMEARFTAQLQETSATMMACLTEAEEMRKTHEEHHVEVVQKLEVGAQAIRKDLEDQCASVETRVTTALQSQRAEIEQSVLTVKTELTAAIADVAATSERSCTSAARKSEAASTARINQLQRDLQLRADREELKISKLENDLKAHAREQASQLQALCGKLSTTHSQAVMSQGDIYARLEKAEQGRNAQRIAIDKLKADFKRKTSTNEKLIFKAQSDIDELSAQTCALALVLTREGPAFAVKLIDYLQLDRVVIENVRDWLYDLAAELNYGGSRERVLQIAQAINRALLTNRW